MSSAPESYLNERRPSLIEAIEREGDMTPREAMESLDKKGYFTPRPRPWQLGRHNRGGGRSDLGILDRFGDLVAEVESREDAELIVAAVNVYRKDKEG